MIRPIFIRTTQIADVVGISLSTIRRKEKAGDWPKSRKLGGCTGWLYSEIESYFNELTDDSR